MRRVFAFLLLLLFCLRMRVYKECISLLWRMEILARPGDTGEEARVRRTKRWLEKERKTTGENRLFQARPGPPLCEVLWLPEPLWDRTKPQAQWEHREDLV